MARSNEKSQSLSPGKKVLFWLILMLLSALVGLLSGEIGVRVLSPQQEAMRWFVSSERYGFRMKSDFRQNYHYLGSDFAMDVETNSLGLRDQEYDLTRSDDRRVLLLGDSFTFGYGVNPQDTFDAKLETLLNQTGTRWSVINAGHGGWGTLQETLYARDHFQLFRPEVIVLTFCGNDPIDDLLFTQQMTDSERGVLYFPGKVWVRDHSHLYRFISAESKHLLHQWMIERKLKDEEDRESLRIDEQSGNLITEAEWQRTLGYIQEFHRDFLKFNPGGILLVQATAPLQEDIRARLISLSNGGNLLYVDLHEEVARLAPSERRLPYDGHWSPKVHSISAEHLYRTILQFVRTPQTEAAHRPPDVHQVNAVSPSQ